VLLKAEERGKEKGESWQRLGPNKGVPQRGGGATATTVEVCERKNRSRKSRPGVRKKMKRQKKGVRYEIGKCAGEN